MDEPLTLTEPVVRILADTEALDKSVNELFDRMQRTIEAARAEWNAEKGTK